MFSALPPKADSDLRVSCPNLSAAVVCASLQCHGDDCALERAADALHGRWIDAKPLGNDPYARPPRSRQSLTDSFLQRRGYRRPTKPLLSPGLISDLQRTAGPYRCATCRQARELHGCARRYFWFHSPAFHFASGQISGTSLPLWVQGSTVQSSLVLRSLITAVLCGPSVNRNRNAGAAIV